MVVLAAAVVTKTGKPLVSRQYAEMNRMKAEGLLASFPKLLSSGKQHTFVETENIRYVYQHIDGLYLVLITDKQSNILEDLETLRLFSKLVPEYCEGLDEASVVSKSFELIFALDEVISLGLKENITLLQVKQNCEMESHEENLHKLIIESKINETKDVMKKRAADIEKAKVEQKRAAASTSSLTAFGSKSGPPMGAPVDIDIPSPGSRPEVAAVPNRPQTGPRAPSRGMQLGKSNPRP